MQQPYQGKLQKEMKVMAAIFVVEDIPEFMNVVAVVTEVITEAATFAGETGDMRTTQM